MESLLRQIPIGFFTGMNLVDIQEFLLEPNEILIKTKCNISDRNPTSAISILPGQFQILIQTECDKTVHNIQETLNWSF